MTVEKRMTKSISKQTTTAAKPFEFYLSWEGTEVVDFKGNVFPSCISVQGRHVQGIWHQRLDLYEPPKSRVDAGESADNSGTKGQNSPGFFQGAACSRLTMTHGKRVRQRN